MGDDDLKSLLEDLLGPLGPVTIKRMFGGGGVFLDGLMLGLVSDGVLFFKTDAVNRPAFEAEGMEPFAYRKASGRTTVMSYWRAPERLLDEPDDMVAWARAALDAARRSKAESRKPPIKRVEGGRALAGAGLTPERVVGAPSPRKGKRG